MSPSWIRISPAGIGRSYISCTILRCEPVSRWLNSSILLRHSCGSRCRGIGAADTGPRLAAVQECSWRCKREQPGRHAGSSPAHLDERPVIWHRLGRVRRQPARGAARGLRDGLLPPRPHAVGVGGLAVPHRGCCCSCCSCRALAGGACAGRAASGGLGGRGGRAAARPLAAWTGLGRRPTPLLALTLFSQRRRELPQRGQSGIP